MISKLLVDLASKYIIDSFNDEGKKNMLSSMTPEAIEGFFDNGFRYHIGEIDGDVVGVVGTRDNSHLFHLFIDDRFQGHGYSSQLWAIGKKACLDSGENPGYFTVNSSLNAQDVYKHWGFIPVGEIREGGGVKDMPMRMEVAS
ncbi:MAG: GNAT family N-acetyltransferase [Pseudomonadales bacterium]|nr:GNAT family N-acetyltransferase [Pseudomonadales bacterium]MBO6564387.1 GNAT family N-acetyltransferase [Pseudomonadales bacterium]MBO6597813.1 GNAT family N-acetyltransferase [Pseudomonadales bacterium]MBO6824525.1 GNAT family N-acetyltransferase [Pseudomonadales bacterium]